MWDQLLRLFRGKPRGPKAPLELTLIDQWLLKILLRDDKRALLVEDLVHEVRGAIRKLALMEMLAREESGAYRIAHKGKKLKDILPERPSVNIDYYG